MKRHFKADMMLLLATIFWGLTFVTVKDAMNYSETFSFIAARFFIGAILVLPFAFKKLKAISKRTLNDALVLGVLVFSGFALQTAGLRETSSTRSAFITGLSVVLVPLISFLINKTKVDIYKLIAILLSALGLFLMFPPDSAPINRGDVLTLACAVVFAFVIVLIQKFTRRNDPLLLVFLQICFVSAISFAMALIFRETRMEFKTNFILDLLFTSVFATAGSLVLQYRYQKQTSETRAAIIYTLEPLFAALFAFLLIGERMAGMAIVGGAAIFIGMLLSEFGE
ncbi:MAG: DMT family transporter [bacterium]|nr:DMT family transporter [bacterium]